MAWQYFDQDVLPFAVTLVPEDIDACVLPSGRATEFTKPDKSISSVRAVAAITAGGLSCKNV
jgi:hypothetical protein